MALPPSLSPLSHFVRYRFYPNRGVSYSDLLEQTRVETANLRLDTSDVPLLDIATELGYRHSTHFSRAFRRVCGISPSEYRTLSHY